MIHLKKYGQTACCGYGGYGEISTEIDDITCKKCKQSLTKKGTEDKKRTAYVLRKSKGVLE
jgi:hypothetical protein